MTGTPYPPLHCNASFVETWNGALRVLVRLDRSEHMLTITQADQLAQMLHEATQLAHERSFDYMAKYA